MLRNLAFVAAVSLALTSMATSPLAFDMQRAREICDSIPLSPPEGVWIYPEDNVTVLVIRRDGSDPNSIGEYDISVVETTDCSVKPGEIIGRLSASPDEQKYEMELFTEKRNGILSRKQTCLATLSKEGETLILQKDKKRGLNFRISLNPSMLLPKMWRMLRTGVSTTSGKSRQEAPVGMVKIYPSYDGNGSSRRSPRYL